ncbi:MAG TPA: ParB N-terminal domain-containing protein [Burkholderiaceae bacterium]|jgi:ParB family chromosome partitioning protein|nr:ParB N-terminal domain-containing protein [Burkholderiaceae bacterium]
MSMRLEKIRCADISPDPRTGGSHHHEVGPLADSIRLHGVLRPVLVRTSAVGYVIVHGERRWRAAQSIGLDAIPAMIVQDFPRTA